MEKLPSTVGWEQVRSVLEMHNLKTDWFDDYSKQYLVDCVNTVDFGVDYTPASLNIFIESQLFHCGVLYGLSKANQTPLDSESSEPTPEMNAILEQTFVVPQENNPAVGVKVLVRRYSDSLAIHTNGDNLGGSPSLSLKVDATGVLVLRIYLSDDCSDGPTHTVRLVAESSMSSLLRGCEGQEVEIAEHFGYDKAAFLQNRQSVVAQLTTVGLHCVESTADVVLENAIDHILLNVSLADLRAYLKSL